MVRCILAPCPPILNLIAPNSFTDLSKFWGHRAHPQPEYAWPTDLSKTSAPANPSHYVMTPLTLSFTPRRKGTSVIYLTYYISFVLNQILWSFTIIKYFFCFTIYELYIMKAFLIVNLKIYYLRCIIIKSISRITK